MKTISLRPTLLCVLVALGGFAGTSCALTSDSPPQVSMTRSMAVLADLERTLSDAASSGNRKAAEELLSPDFEFRPAEHPGEPTTRSDWLADASKRGNGSGQLSVRDLGDVSVASFVMSLDDGTSSFVVDVWQKLDNHWRLISRYQSALQATDLPAGDIAPTGKG